jgi:3-mercaptopyruvate sulfurtransferase SseA
MRLITLVSLALLVTIAGLAACNSSEALLSHTSTASPTPAAPTPADSARRIKAAELHELWEKGNVVIIDTRSEAAYKDEHIKGSISVPAGTVLSKLDELPKNKMIVAYCT